MKNHIGQFETLRFAASFWVFLSHILLIVERPMRFVAEGGLAVDLFVILSGYVITIMLLKRPESYTSYIFRRFLRLYPLYLVALVLGIMTQAFYAPVIGDSLFGAAEKSGFIERAALVDDNFWQNIAVHLTMLHGAVPDEALPMSALVFSGPLWSISLEWQFYLVAPLVLWTVDVRKPGRWKIAVPVLASILVLRSVTGPWWTAGVPSFLPLRLPLFALGIFCGLAWSRLPKISVWKVLAVIAPVMLALILLNHRAPPLFMWFAVYLAAGYAGRSKIADALNAVLCFKPFVWLGTRSYGLYVLHMPIVLFVAGTLLVPYASPLGRSGMFAALLATYGLVVACAAFMYCYVEMPVIAWGKRMKLGATPSVATGSADLKTA